MKKNIDRSKNEYAKKLGKNIRRIRINSGYSQMDLDSDESFVGHVLSRAQLERIELGMCSPTVDLLHRIADALGVSITEFFKNPDGSDI